MHAFRFRVMLAGAVIAAQAALPSVAAAASTATTTRYSVRFLGFPIAQAAFTTVMEGKAYSISGSLRSAGLAEIFDRTRATTEVSGVVKSDRLQARSYSVSYTSGKKTSHTRVTFRNGNVRSSEQTPKEEHHDKHWVGLSKADLKSVLDPISGLIVPAGTPVCPRTIPVFDGETRADIVLTPTGREPFTTDGYNGPAIACSMRFVPKAGYRSTNSSIRYLRKLTSMVIWFAPSPSGKVLAPVYARVPTKIGSVTVWATHVGH